MTVSAGRGFQIAYTRSYYTGFSHARTKTDRPSGAGYPARPEDDRRPSAPIPARSAPSGIAPAPDSGPGGCLALDPGPGIWAPGVGTERARQPAMVPARRDRRHCRRWGTDL